MRSKANNASIAEITVDQSGADGGEFMIGTSFDDAGDGGCSLNASVFNLVNNVAGAGILTLSAGMGAGVGWVPAIVICVAMAGVSAYTFSIAGVSCHLAGKSTFTGVWTKSFGPRTSWFVDAIVCALCLASCIIYFGILGDVFTPIVQAVGSYFGSPHITRNCTIILFAGLLLPFALARNIDFLSRVSLVGFGSILYTILFMVLRCFDGSYAADSAWASSLPATLAPDLGAQALWTFNRAALVLMSNLGLALIAHYNAPKYYAELEDRSPRKFSIMVSCAFFILCIFYLASMGSGVLLQSAFSRDAPQQYFLITCGWKGLTKPVDSEIVGARELTNVFPDNYAGYGTFGANAQPNILLNYHPDDILASIAKIATGLSVLAGFPLQFMGIKEAAQRLLRRINNDVAAWLRKTDRPAPLVFCLLTVMTFVATTLPDIGFIASITGALLGAAIVYIIPPMLYVALLRKRKTPGDGRAWKTVPNMLITVFGVCFAALGVAEVLGF
eukprot:gene7252-8639_t